MVIHPNEPVLTRRWEKIAQALGTRTARQVGYTRPFIMSRMLTLLPFPIRRYAVEFRSILFVWLRPDFRYRDARPILHMLRPNLNGVPIIGPEDNVAIPLR